MGFTTQSNYNNAALGTSAVIAPVPAKIGNRSGVGAGNIRVAKSARVKNASPTNIVYVKQLAALNDAAASPTNHDLQINPGLEDDIELKYKTVGLSVVSSAAGTPISITFGGQVF